MASAGLPIFVTTVGPDERFALTCTRRGAVKVTTADDGAEEEAFLIASPSESAPDGMSTEITGLATPNSLSGSTAAFRISSMARAAKPLSGHPTYFDYVQGET